MLPTISLRSYILVSRLKPKLKRGDVITFTSPIEPQKGLVKRIIGLEGDVILNDGNKYEIPMGHLWVVGDNLNFSIDSRDFGPVSVGLVHGKVVFDFNRFRFIV